MKNYPEYDFEQMKKDLEYFGRENDDIDQDEEENEKIEIQYYNQHEFDNLKKMILWETNQIVRKKKTYKLLHEDCFCDYFCKMMISYFANTDSKITPNKLHKSKNGRNLIVSGKYTEWKGYFMDSVLSERFGVKSLEYKKPDLNSLLENTYTCIYIIQTYIKDNNDTIDFDSDEISNKIYEMYEILEKIIKAYQTKQTYTDLNKKEKNTLSYLLWNEVLEKEELPRGSISYYSRSSVINETYMSKSQLQVICRRLKKIDLSNLIEKRDVKRIVNENADERQVNFPEFLSPIIAAICENRKDNPFYNEENIRGSLEKEIIYFNIPEIENTEKERLSIEFAKYYRYYKFVNSRMYDEDKILSKYYYFLNLLINKIKMYKPKYNNKYVHYYLVEKIMGLQLFEVETKIISNYLDDDLMEFKRKHYELKAILKKIYEFRGCISRIRLAECVLTEYFSIYKRNADDLDKYEFEVNDLKKRLEHTNVVDELRERLYIEDFPDDVEIYISQYESKKDFDEQTNLKVAMEKLDVFYKYEEQIKVDDVNFNRHIPGRKINEIVSFQIQEKDTIWNDIKKWVISKSFF